MLVTLFDFFRFPDSPSLWMLIQVNVKVSTLYILNSFVYIFLYIYFFLQHERLGKKSLGDVINGPSLDPSDPFCTDEDAALKALAKKFETKYVSLCI